MAGELKFSEEVFGLGFGTFFIGYLIREIPGALLVEHWSARMNLEKAVHSRRASARRSHKQNPRPSPAEARKTRRLATENLCVLCASAVKGMLDQWHGLRI
jgi:hypothetical protein